MTMKWWRNLKKEDQDNTASERGLTAGEIAVRKVLSKFALYLQTRTQKIPLAAHRILLVLFCFTWGASSLYLILSAFTPEKKVLINIQKIQVPKYYQQTGEERLKVRPSTVNKGSLKVKVFLDSMNRLNSSAKGKRVYDSILSARPRLMDSIRRLELVQSNQK